MERVTLIQQRLLGGLLHRLNVVQQVWLLCICVYVNVEHCADCRTSLRCNFDKYSCFVSTGAVDIKNSAYQCDEGEWRTTIANAKNRTKEYKENRY